MRMKLSLAEADENSVVVPSRKIEIFEKMVDLWRFISENFPVVTQTLGRNCRVFIRSKIRLRGDSGYRGLIGILKNVLNF